MNYIGKILTVLILLMSVAFLVVAVMLGATHRNWKAEASQLRSEADRLRRVSEDAKSRGGEKDLVLARERVARQRQLAQLESRLQIAEANFAERERALQVAQTSVTTNSDLLTQAEARLRAQDEELRELKEARRQLSADIAEKFSLVQNLTNQIYELSNELEVLRKTNGDLSSSLAQKTRVMKANGLTDTDLTDQIVPQLSGVVIQVAQDNEKWLVAIGLGTDDGLRVGHELDVYRNDRYIGKIRITKTDHNGAVGQAIRDFMQDRIREGDYVTSRL